MSCFRFHEGEASRISVQEQTGNELRGRGGNRGQASCLLLLTKGQFAAMIDDLWYKNAIFYCLSVGSYMDSNGDGVGDFKGLLRRLDYLHGLGVTAIWLMPFQPSPFRDDGYDISDYYGVDPRYGT